MWFNRPDGTLVRDVPPVRGILPYLMRGRNESAVYLEQRLDLTAALPALAAYNATREGHATVFHLVLYALARTLHERPRLNRFVAGGRIYQRDGVWLSWAAKQRFADDGPLVVVKRRFEPDEEFDLAVLDIAARNGRARRGERTSSDRELGVVLGLPGLGRRAAVAIERVADAFGLLPRWYLEGDPLFTSVFVANLGSLGLGGAYHHLYEYGNATTFCAVGAIEPYAVHGTPEGVVTRPELPVRFTFDERVEDGFVAHAALERFRELVEDPATYPTALRSRVSASSIPRASTSRSGTLPASPVTPKVS